MSANIEALVKKHSRAFSGDVRGLRNALTEQAEAFKGELRAYDGTVRELTKTVEDMRAVQSVPVVGDAVALQAHLEKIRGEAHGGAMLGHDAAYKACLEIDAAVSRIFQEMRNGKITTPITAAELATLREKAAMVDELRKDADRLRRLESEISDRLYSYERFGATCTFEGLPMVNADILEELAAIAQGKGE